MRQLQAPVARWQVAVYVGVADADGRGIGILKRLRHFEISGSVKKPMLLPEDYRHSYVVLRPRWRREPLRGNALCV
jgi:hypothetical protein